MAVRIRTPPEMDFKRIIIVLTLIGSAALAAYADWQKQNSGTLAWLQAVQFLDGQTGFAAGSNGTLLATNDGGGRWTKIPIPGKDMIRDVHFVDRSNGWMLCDRGKFRSGANPSYLLRTADGGKTWTAVEFKNSPERFSRLIFSAGGIGFLIGEGGVMSGLPSGEKTETRTVLPARFLMTDGAAPDGSRMLLIGGRGSLIASDDGGRIWRQAGFTGAHPESKLNSVFFVDSERGWVSGNGGILFSTSDGGRSWNPQRSATEIDLLDVAFYDLEIGFAVGDGGIVVRTTDSGKSWAVEKSGTKHRLERLAFAGRRAIAVGFGGTIISTDLP
jgi:photosystem II stability/assembly factor-like uncharacterized protein